MTRPIHIHPTTDLAERVLLPGDPGRALRLCQELIDEPKMFNHNRGLWGYTGPAKADGQPLTIQSTGMGGPSAAIIISELIELGAQRLVRIGTSGGLDPSLTLGQLLIVSEAICDDGSSRTLSGGAERVSGSPRLLDSLLRGAEALPDDGGSQATIVSTDLFYDADHRPPEWVAQGARAVEMETATLFALAARRGVEAGAVLIVSDLVLPTPVRIGDAELLAAESRLGQTAVAGLVQHSQPV